MQLDRWATSHCVALVAQVIKTRHQTTKTHGAHQGPNLQALCAPGLNLLPTVLAESPHRSGGRLFPHLSTTQRNYYAMAPGKKDALGGYMPDMFTTSKGVELATYLWAPPCGVEAAKGCVFLMHGIFAHNRFEYLEPDGDNRLVLYEGSLPEALKTRTCSSSATTTRRTGCRPGCAGIGRVSMSSATRRSST